MSAPWAPSGNAIVRLPIPAIVGFVDRVDEERGPLLHNAAAVLADGALVSVHHKSLLPTYDVFDEARYFAPGRVPEKLWGIGGVVAGVSVCEDIWSPFGPLTEQAAGGAELSVNINGSQYHWEKDTGRERMVATRAQDSHTAIVYVNQVGGQDELVFDGASVVVDAAGSILHRSPQFMEDLFVLDVPVGDAPGAVATVAPLMDDVRRAVGIR